MGRPFNLYRGPTDVLGAHERNLRLNARVVDEQVLGGDHLPSAVAALLQVLELLLNLLELLRLLRARSPADGELDDVGVRVEGVDFLRDGFLVKLKQKKQRVGRSRQSVGTEKKK